MKTKTYNPYHTDNIPKDPKEFAMYAIAPYWKDPSVCGFNGFTCQYLTKDKKMCVAGRFMKPEFRERVGNGNTIDYVIDAHPGGQNEVFIPEVVGILSTNHWIKLQRIHDCLAGGQVDLVKERINLLGVFTIEELEEYCKTH